MKPGNLSRLVRAILLVALFAPLWSVHHAQAGTPGSSGTIRFDHLSLEQGLSQSSVRAILQDRQGFMWFGTKDGLNKYNGYQFTIFQNQPEAANSLSNDFILSLYEDPSGNLWIGTLGGGLNRFNRTEGTFAHYRYNPQDPNSLSDDIVRAIYADQSGKLWIGTENGLNRLDPGTGEITRYQHDPRQKNSLSNNHVYCLIEDQSGQLWVGTQNGLNLLDRNTGAFTVFKSSSDNPLTLSDNQILSLYQDRSGKLWVGTNNGLNRLDPLTGMFRRFLNESYDPTSLSDKTVRAIFEDRAGTIWIGTDNGLNRFERETASFTRFLNQPNLQHSLSDSRIMSLYEDRSGVLWIGTFSGGLNKFDRTMEAFQYYQHNPDNEFSISHNNVLALYKTRAGVLWAGTGKGLNKFNASAGTFTRYLHKPGNLQTISDDSILAILEDRAKNLWIGTERGGLNLYQPGGDTFISFRYDPENPYSLGSDTVHALYQDRSGVLWIGTQNGLNRFNLPAKYFSRFQHNPNNPTSLSDNTVLSIVEDAQGLLWIGTEHGLNRFDPAHGIFTAYLHDATDPNSLSNDTVNSLYVGPDDTLWIGTAGGLDQLDPLRNTFRHYRDWNGLPNDTINCILPDDEGNLWVSTNQGLSKLIRSSDTFRNYDSSDGLQSNEFNVQSCFRADDGQMLFGGINGFNAFSPQKIQDSAYPPPMVLTAFNIFNQTVETDITQSREIELSYLDNFISFEFAALDYAAPEKNQYLYQMEGFDRDWIAAGTRHYASYTNLPPRDYSFRVRGSNNDGVWNQEGLTLQIHIRPPFWQTWWFRILSGVCLFGVVLGSYTLRLKTVQRQKSRLEIQVAERTAEIERRRKVAEGLREILAMLNSSRPLQESLDYIARQAAQLMGVESTVLFRLEGDPPQPRIEATCGSILLAEAERSITRSSPFGWDGCIQYLQAKRHYFNSDLTGSQDLPQRYRAFLCVPLIVNEQVYGGLGLYYTEQKSFSQEEIHLVASFTDQAALAIENARLREQVEQTAVAAERSRLARDLHDAVTQTLFSTSLIADVLPRLWEQDPEEARRQLEQIRLLTRGALAEMRALLLELRPSTLTEADLGDVLRQLCEAFTSRAQVPVDLSVSGHCPLLPDVQVGLYRMAQELLNNIAKHARATRVNVWLNCQDGQVELLIVDNGCGFDRTKVPPERLGLGILAERAHSLGATLRIDSQPGQGTRASITWSSNHCTEGPVLHE